MNKSMVCALLVAGIVGVFAGRVEAGSWETAGTYDASGTATTDVRARSLSISSVRITCTEGSVKIVSIVVKQRENEQTVNVGEKLSKGESKDVDLSFYLGTTAIAINHEGSGRFEVQTK